MRILALALAGSVGALSRWAIGTAAIRALGTQFPYGTLAVNVLGCLIAGFAMQLFASGALLPPSWRIPLTVGFLGSFTTFSAFGYESVKLAQTGAWGAAMANVALNLALGFTAVWIGFFVARAAFGGS